MSYEQVVGTLGALFALAGTTLLAETTPTERQRRQTRSARNSPRAGRELAIKGAPYAAPR